MTWKQERFCEEFLIDADAKAAAIRAGYSPGTHSVAAKLMNSKEVRERICQLKERIRSSDTARAAEVTEFLTAVMRGEVEELKTSSKDRMHAAELLGKRYGVFSDKDGDEEQATVIISGEEQLK